MNKLKLGIAMFFCSVTTSATYCMERSIVGDVPQECQHQSDKAKTIVVDARNLNGPVDHLNSLEKGHRLAVWIHGIAQEPVPVIFVKLALEDDERYYSARYVMYHLTGANFGIPDYLIQQGIQVTGRLVDRHRIASGEITSEDMAFLGCSNGSILIDNQSVENVTKEDEIKN